MNKQVEIIERGNVEVSSMCEPFRLAIHPPVEVEARVENGDSLPVEVGRVSLFSSALSARSVADIDIISFLTSTRYMGIVCEIRASTDPDTRRELKKKLPAITPAGVFYPQRGTVYIASYSGCICIDIDGKDNPIVKDWSATAHRIGAHSPCVLYAGLSAGGNGCFVVYRVATPQRYAEHYARLVAELQGIGLNPDPACKDLARLRFASYDPMPYLNAEATPHSLPRNALKEPIPQPQHTAPDRATNDQREAPKTPDSTLPIHRIAQAVAAIVEQRKNIAEAYPDWWRIGCSLASTYGEQARPLYHAISAQSGKYNYKECDAQYTRCMRPRGIGIGTLCHYLKAAGVRW